jgi:hypothetical protein
VSTSSFGTILYFPCNRFGSTRFLYIICEYDALRDEGLILNERMNRIKHPLQHLHLSGSEHGVLLFPYYSIYKTSLEKIVYYIQQVTHWAQRTKTNKTQHNMCWTPLFPNKHK